MKGKKEADRNTKTRQKVQTDKKWVFHRSGLSSLHVLRIENFSSDLSCRLINVWHFLNFPVVSLSTAFGSEMNGANAAMETLDRPLTGTLSGLCFSWEIVCEQCRTQVLVCEVVSSQRHNQVISNNTLKTVDQVRTKTGKTRVFLFKVFLHFLLSSRRFDCDTFFRVTVSLLNDCVPFPQLWWFRLPGGEILTRLIVLW